MSADNYDPFALGGVQDDDAALFELIAEYDRREADASKAGDDEDETDRRCSYADETRKQIEAYRPVTLRGVLAVLELINDRPELQGDPNWWPEGAIEGLRAIVERGEEPGVLK
jgi:hypothetical protein